MALSGNRQSDLASSISGRSAVSKQQAERHPNPVQLKRLALLAGVPAEKLAHKSVAALQDELVFLNPDLFNFELVCGQVVKVDPGTGLKYPVSGATVTVYDTDCDWLWYFPPGWPWSWAFRFPRCTRDLVTSVVTDSCGNFCVFIPRWDIEWVRLWIRERWCFPQILRRPSVADLLIPHLVPTNHTPTPPNPPDPADLAALLDVREDLASVIGARAVETIRRAARTRTIGSPRSALVDVLASRAFSRKVTAPVPAELRALHPAESTRVLASRLGMAVGEASLDLSASFGPFQRCIEAEVAVWLPFFEVPDISFEVTQDVDGDGTAEVIYDGAFDGHWEVFPVAELELDVDQAAIASPFPGCAPTPVPCENEAAITEIGYLAVDPAYLDPNSGFAVRMNKPNATPNHPSSAPFGGYLPLFGCATGAQYYRVMASYASSDGLTTLNPDGSLAAVASSAFGAALPVVAPAWQVSRLVGGLPELSPPIQPVDSDGWYSTQYLSWEPQNLLVNWAPADGVYQLQVETGNGTPGSIAPAGASTPAIRMVVDTSRPLVSCLATNWRLLGGAWIPITNVDGCQIIHRPGADIEVQITYTATASHLYSVSLQPDGCDLAGVTLTSTDPASAGYTYDGPFDNHLDGVATYRISADAAPGCYSWTMTVYSRAFSPNDSGDLTDVAGFAWNTVDTPLYTQQTVTVAIVAE